MNFTEKGELKGFGRGEVFCMDRRGRLKDLFKNQTQSQEKAEIYLAGL